MSRVTLISDSLSAPKAIVRDTPVNGIPSFCATGLILADRVYRHCFRSKLLQQQMKLGCASLSVTIELYTTIVYISEIGPESVHETGKPVKKYFLVSQWDICYINDSVLGPSRWKRRDQILNRKVLLESTVTWILSSFNSNPTDYSGNQRTFITFQ